MKFKTWQYKTYRISSENIYTFGYPCGNNFPLPSSQASPLKERKIKRKMRKKKPNAYRNGTLI